MPLSGHQSASFWCHCDEKRPKQHLYFRRHWTKLWYFWAWMSYHVEVQRMVLLWYDMIRWDRETLVHSIRKFVGLFVRFRVCTPPRSGSSSILPARSTLLYSHYSYRKHRSRRKLRLPQWAAMQASSLSSWYLYIKWNSISPINILFIKACPDEVRRRNNEIAVTRGSDFGTFV